MARSLPGFRGPGPAPSLRFDKCLERLFSASLRLEFVAAFGIAIVLPEEFFLGLGDALGKSSLLHKVDFEGIQPQLPLMLGVPLPTQVFAKMAAIVLFFLLHEFHHIALPALVFVGGADNFRLVPSDWFAFVKEIHLTFIL